MENRFRQQEFEEFLQGQLKNYRMYPSDGVWRNIHKSIHGSKSWPALTIGAFVILSMTAFICFYFTPKPDIFAVKPVAASTEKAVATGKSNVGSFTNQPFAGQDVTVRYYNEPSRQTSTLSSMISEETTAMDDIPVLLAENTIVPLAKTEKEVRVYRSEGAPSTPAAEDNKADNLFNLSQKLAVMLRSQSSDALILPPLNADNKTASLTREIQLKTLPADKSTSLIQEFKDKHLKGKKKLSLQVYAATSVSYRQLYEEKQNNEDDAEGPVSLSRVADVKNVIRHRPGRGLEAGFSFLYSMSNTIRVKTGFQFNYRTYNIEAYRSSTEVASIALDNLDTVNTLSMYRISNGNSSAELANRYYQLSMPLGIEWQIMGNRKIQWNVAGTIQPTYLLNKDAYLISTNYKNYTEKPDMVRSWNLNSNIETFLSIRAGEFKWQVGPQIRYQPYSTFISAYPIKEHLLDYGIKLGLSRGF